MIACSAERRAAPARPDLPSPPTWLAIDGRIEVPTLGRHHAKTQGTHRCTGLPHFRRAFCHYKEHGHFQDFRRAQFDLTAPVLVDPGPIRDKDRVPCAEQHQLLCSRGGGCCLVLAWCLLGACWCLLVASALLDGPDRGTGGAIMFRAPPSQHHFYASPQVAPRKKQSNVNIDHRPSVLQQSQGSYWPTNKLRRYFYEI